MSTMETMRKQGKGGSFMEKNMSSRSSLKKVNRYNFFNEYVL